MNDFRSSSSSSSSSYDSAVGPPQAAKSTYSELMYSSICQQYEVLKSAVHGKQGLKASTPTVSLSQPWK